MPIITGIVQHLYAFVAYLISPISGEVVDGAKLAYSQRIFSLIEYDPNDPLRLWAVQVVVILVCTQALSLILGRFRQPRVIAEVLSGVVLGPSLMGRIPGFSSTIFPSQSIPLLNLTANLGLVFFLFLVGLEIDTRVVRKNARTSLTISSAGFILPCAFGALLAGPIYRRFIDDGVNFVFFQLFIATAVGITAFPVLCRILTELRLLDTTVGVVVLSAGVGNDVVGWTFLALTVALVNAGSGLAALWVLATCIAYTIFLLIPVRRAFIWLAKVTGSLENGHPTATMVTVTLLLVIVSAVFTDIIGVHCIFGGFLAGLLIPHEGGFAIALVEKLEDFVSIMFLPIYFTLSGLKTDLATLDSGAAWAFILLICLVAFCGKFCGSFFTARMLGFTFREAGAIGSLMSCKGLVELIVLNVGLEAKILNTRVFSMFVVEALVLTFMTTPLTLLWYPERHRSVVPAMGDLWSTEGPSSRADNTEESERKELAVVLTKIEHLPALMTISELIWSRAPVEVSKRHDSSTTLIDESKLTGPSLSLNVLRLIELTDRVSAVLRSQDTDSLVHRDSAISIFRTFSSLHQIPASALLSVAKREDFPTAISNHIQQTGSHMTIIPWNLELLIPENVIDDHASGVIPSANPFEGVFSKSETSRSVIYPHVIRKVFTQSPVDVIVYVDRGHSATGTTFSNHIFMPFFGGADDRAALNFIVQMCTNTNNTATVIRFTRSKSSQTPVGSTFQASTAHQDRVDGDTVLHEQLIAGAEDTLYGHQDTQMQLASDTADELLWSQLTTQPHGRYNEKVLRRIKFSEQSSHPSLYGLIEAASDEASYTAASSKKLFVAVGRNRRTATNAFRDTELNQIMNDNEKVGGEVTKALGNVATAYLAVGISSGILVAHSASATYSDRV